MIFFAVYSNVPLESFRDSRALLYLLSLEIVNTKQ